MKGDFSRNTFDKKKRFTSVRMQQGRVQLDADWNEQMDILDNRIRVGSEDFIGGSGAPSGNPGYKITSTTTDLTISKGRFYVQGVLIEKDKQEKFTEQADFPNAVLPTVAGLYLVYLDVWQQGISAAIDPSIEEPALNGADTTMRIKNIAQVKLLALPNNQYIGTGLKCSTVIDKDTKNKTAWQTAIAASTGKLSATVSPNANLKNQLYRIEIHKGGDEKTATFKWSRDNGALVGKVKSINGNIITIANSGGTTLNFKAGQWVELSTNKRTLKNQSGKFVRLLKITNNELTLIQSLTNTEQSEFLSKDVITTIRQWNIDEKLTQTNNFFPIKSIRENNTIKITLTADNKPANLAKNVLVELKKDKNAVRGSFSQIKSINGNTLIVNDFAKTDAEIKELTLIRVVTSAINSVNSNGSISIENGLSITFTVGSYKAGDYWLIPTRAETNNIASTQYDFKTPQLPEGIVHYHAQLALIRKTGTIWQIAGDCRNIISALGNKAYKSEPGDNESSVFVDKTGNVAVKKQLQVDGNAEFKKGVTITGETKMSSLTSTGNINAGSITTTGETTTDSLRLGTNTINIIAIALTGERTNAIVTEKAIKNYLDDLLIGSISAFATTTVPTGWLECNGSVVSRTNYAKLFSKIGVTHGKGDGSTTFNLPDLRGEFIRGWDNKRGIDKDRALATMQFDQMQSHKHTDSGHVHTDKGHTHKDAGHFHLDKGHTHTVQMGNNTASGPDTWVQHSDLHGGNWGKHTTSKEKAQIERGEAKIVIDYAKIQTDYAKLSNPTSSTQGTPRHGSETRPRNVALMYCIKY